MHLTSWLQNLRARMFPGKVSCLPQPSCASRRRQRSKGIVATEALETRILLSAAPVPIASGETIEGSIDTLAEEDCYTINAAEGDELLLTVGETGFNDGSCDLEVTLYTPDGSELQTVAMDTGFRLDQRNLEQTGTYTYVVREIEGNRVGDYSLTAELTQEQFDATVSVNNVTQDEDTGTMTFTVSLTRAVGMDVLVDFITVNDTARSGEDHAFTNGTVTIQVGTRPTSTTSSATVIVATDRTRSVPMSRRTGGISSRPNSVTGRLWTTSKFATATPVRF